RNDCGMLQGDGHADKNKYNGFINDWRLAGIVGDPNKHDAAKHTLQCDNASPIVGTEQDNCAIDAVGDKVTYFYTVTNNSTTSSVTVNIEDDKKTPSNVVASNVTLLPKGSPNNGNVKKYSWG